MADLVTVGSGAAPWMPSLESTIVEIYNRHDVPTAGILQQHGVQFLFECISEGPSRVSVWAYALIEPSERSQIEDAPPEEFEAQLDAVLRSRSSVLALALEGFGVLVSTEVEDWWHDSLRELNRLFELFGGWLDGLRQAADSQLASLRATSKEARRS